MLDGINWDSLTEREVVRGDITYQIGEITDAEQALDVFETLRLSLGGVQSASPVAVISALSRDDFLRVRDIFYQHIRYRDGKSAKFKPIANNGNAPFAGQSPMIHYEL